MHPPAKMMWFKDNLEKRLWGLYNVVIGIDYMKKMKRNMGILGDVYKEKYGIDA